MLFLLRGISWPYFRRHWVISLLSLVGIALGVGVYVAVQLSASSLRTSLRDTIDRIAGSTQLEVSAGESGVPEATLEAVREVAGVASAQPIIEAVVKPSEIEESSLLVLGIDFLGDIEVRSWEFDGEDVLDDPLLFLAQPDSICLTEVFAARHRLGEGGTLRLETGHGVRAFTVRGILRSQGPADAFGGNVALMDLYAAQYMFSRGRRLDRIDVVLDHELTLEEGRERLQTVLGPGFTVDTPAQRGAEMESLIRNFGATLALSSWQAIFIAVFLIFNVFAVAAARRRREIGILRSLGVTRRRIQQLFLAEGAVLGLIGASLGLGAGVALAGGSTQFMIRLTEEAYGLTHSAPVLVVQTHVLLEGFGLGLLSALVAAFLPARSAAALPPVEALAKGRFQVFTKGRSRARHLSGLVVAALTAVEIALLARRSLGWSILGLMMINLSAVLLAPTLITLLVRLLRPLFEGLFGAEGRIAADSLALAPRRTSATVLALTLSVAFVVNLAGLVQSFRSSYLLWMDGVINADFYVTASERFFSKSHHLPPEFEEIVAQIPGVRWVEPYRNVHIQYGDRRPVLGSLPLAKTYRRLEVDLVAGSREALLERVPRGEGVTVSENFARLTGLWLGDTVELPSPTGTVSLPILAVARDYGSDQGIIYLDRSVYTERWMDDRIDILDVLLEEGADQQAVAAEIRRRLATKTDRLFIMTRSDLKGRIERILDQFFALSYIQLVIGLAVAVLGIMNTLVISVTERRRELGILKALGTQRRQVVALIAIEALGITLCGGALGVVLGSYLIYYSVDTISYTSAGWILPFAFPWAMAAGLVPLLVVASVVAAAYPAWLAVRVPPSEALEFE